jgi:hypothetical protein
MIKNRETICSICNGTIRTVRCAMQLQNAPLVCRRCFGEQSYGGSQHWKSHNTASPDAVTSES